MENRIRKHIEGIFASAPGTAKAREIREEMIINVIERYHDHLGEGMSEEDAYRAAITGIGDVSGLIDSLRRDAAANGAGTPPPPPQQRYAPPAANPPYQTYQKRGLSTGAVVAIVICSTILLLTLISGIIAARITGQLFSGNGFLSNLLGFVRDETNFGFHLGNFSFESDEGFDNAYAASGEYSLGAESIDSIEVNWVSGAVKVLPAPEGVEEIVFSESSNRGVTSEYALRYRLSGGKLTIRYCAARVWKGIDWNDLFNPDNVPSKELVLYLPASLLGGGLASLNINGVSNALEVRDIAIGDAAFYAVSGSIGVYDSTFDALKAESVSGETVVEGCAGRELRANAVSGAVRADSAFEEYDLGTVSGDIYANIEKASGKVDAESVSGNITLKLGGSYGFTVDMETVSGRFESGGLPVTVAGEDRYVYGDGALEIEVETVSGNVIVEE